MEDKDINAVVERVTAAATSQIEANLVLKMKDQMATVLADLSRKADEDEAKKKSKENPWPTLGTFLCAVRDFRILGKQDERLHYVDHEGKIATPPKTKTLTEGVDSAGGFLVPEIFIPTLKMLELEGAIVRPNGATVIPMPSDTINIPRVDDTSHVTNFFGGCLGYWMEEAGAKTTSEPKFGNIKMIAKKLGGYTQISNELLADSAIALDPLIRTMFARTWAWMEDDAFLNGNGIGQPLGIINSGALVTVTRQAANHVYFMDLPNMIVRLLPGSFMRAIWVLNPSVFPEIIALTTSNTAPSAGANAIWINSQMGAANPLPGTIFGRPFFISEKCAALGTTGDICLYDLSYYLIGDRQPMTIDVSTHVGFLYDTTYYRFVLRVDGQPWMQSTLTPHRGNTLSPFVVLSTGS
jgi:HK97 family phage major capsid protein